jgi:outer membrane protein assembly factor BamB
VLGVIATIAVLALFFGLRLEFTGAGRPRLAFVPANDEQAEIVARHRAAQRAEAPAAPPTGVPDPAPGAATVAPAPAPRVNAPPAAAGSARYWTDFRGPRRDGHYRERAVLTSWPASGLRQLWKQPVGGGYASFVAADGRAFTIEQRGREETVAAYDVTTGRELWTHAWTDLFDEAMGGPGPRATPTWFDGVVFALGGAGELRALDAVTGRLIWRTNILEENGATNLDWGMAASPLVLGNTVVVVPGGPSGRSVVAYDRATGRRVWSAESDKAGYSSPMLVSLAGREQILVFAGTRLVSLTPDRGELLWSHPWRTMADINVAQPLVVSDNRVFISSGYDVGGALLEITSSASGFAVREVWRNNRMKNRFASSVLHEGFIYGLDESILACVDAATGELKWKGGRYGYGQLVLASGRLIVLTEGGDLVLVAATPDRHEEISRFPALEGKSWNHPAIADGILLVRNLREMAAFDIRGPGSQAARIDADGRR